MAIKTLTELLIKIFIMIGVGYFLRKKEIITTELKQGLNNLIMNVILPFSIIASGNGEFSPEVSKSLLLATLFCIIYYIAALLIGMAVGKGLRLEEKKARMFTLLVTFANTGFLGIPLATELYGTPGVLVAVIYNLVFDVIFFTYGIYYVGREGRFDLRQLFGNVVAVSAIFSVVLYCSPFRLPKVIVDTCTALGDPMVPLSMIVIGCGLAEVDFLEVLKNKHAYIVSLMRLVVFPVAAFMIVKAAGMEPVTAAACVMLTALPPGATNVIVAEQYDCAPEFATQAVVQSMVLMIVTLPLIILLVS